MINDDWAGQSLIHGLCVFVEVVYCDVVVDVWIATSDGRLAPCCSWTARGFWIPFGGCVRLTLDQPSGQLTLPRKPFEPERQAIHPGAQALQRP